MNVDTEKKVQGMKGLKQNCCLLISQYTKNKVFGVVTGKDALK